MTTTAAPVNADGLVVTVLVATTALLAALLALAVVTATTVAEDAVTVDAAAAIVDEVIAEEATTEEVTDALALAVLVATRLVLITTGPGPSGMLVKDDSAAVDKAIG